MEIGPKLPQNAVSASVKWPYALSRRVTGTTTVFPDVKTPVTTEKKRDGREEALDQEFGGDTALTWDVD